VREHDIYRHIKRLIRVASHGHQDKKTDRPQNDKMSFLIIRDDKISLWGDL